MFGPHERRVPPNSQQSMVWKSQGARVYDDLAQMFHCQTFTAGVLGCTAPDPDLKWNEENRSHYDFGAIDWKEFTQAYSKGMALVTVNVFHTPRKR